MTGCGPKNIGSLMERLRFLEIFGILAMGGAIMGCDQSKETSKDHQMTKSLPPFSSDRLHQLLEELRLKFESKGLNVSGTLLPPLADHEIREKCDWFPGEIVSELMALYSWRGGQEPGPWNLAKAQPWHILIQLTSQRPAAISRQAKGF